MKIVKFILSSSLILILGCNSSGVYFEDTLCIENITIIDPITGPLENQTLIIQNGIISQIIQSTDITLSPKNTIIDGKGKYIIPGLWDSHIHFAYLEELAPHMFDLFLSYGITSVRDTGGKVHFVKSWKDRAAKNISSAPRVMMAGPLLDGSPNVYDGSDPGHPPLSVGLKTVEDVRRQIEILDSLDVDFLKAYEMLTPEQFQEVMAIAHEKGLKVTGHVPLSMDVISASNAGLNSMEHLRNLEMSCASNWEDLLKYRQEMLRLGANEAGGDLRSKIHAAQRIPAINQYDSIITDNVLNALAKNQTWQIPTLALYEAISNRPIEAFNNLPENMSKEWLNSYKFYSDAPVQQDRVLYSKWQIDMIGEINKAGIGIMAGTDTPIGLLVPGRSLHDELRLLVSAGMTPLEALRSATYNPAKYFNMDHELGRVKENMLSDLVILDDNPLTDITNTLNINTVIKQGKIYNGNANNVKDK